MQKNYTGNNQPNAPKGAFKKVWEQTFKLFSKYCEDKELMRLIESSIKQLQSNTMIRLKSPERPFAVMGQVYLVNLGFRPDSRIRGFHYIVPYFVSGTTVLVAPLTTKKGTRFIKRILLGPIEELYSLEIYASVGQSCSMSFTDLQGHSVSFKLKDEQLKKIVQDLNKTLQNYSSKL